MREIKFRGKRVDNGKWVYGYYSSSDEMPIRGDTGHFIKCGPNEEYRVIPETVGQYTGLKDKSGVEIYEGDILHAKGDGKLAAINQESYFKVKWNDKHACFTFLRKYYPALDEFSIVYDMATNMIFGICEIIGNIHDNLDLIKRNTAQ